MKCPLCDEGELINNSVKRRFTHRKVEFTVDLPEDICTYCGTGMLSGKQWDENINRIKQAKAEIDSWLIK